MDNLDTNKLFTLYEVFAPAETSRLARGIGVHHTPRHGSWTDMAARGTNVPARQCPGWRIQDRDMPRRETVAWERRRNRSTDGSGPMMPAQAEIPVPFYTIEL